MEKVRVLRVQLVGAQLASVRGDLGDGDRAGAGLVLWPAEPSCGHRLDKEVSWARVPSIPYRCLQYNVGRLSYLSHIGSSVHTG